MLRELESNAVLRIEVSVFTGPVFRRQRPSPTSRGAGALSSESVEMRYPVPKAVRMDPSGSNFDELAWLLEFQSHGPFLRVPGQE